MGTDIHGVFQRRDHESGKWLDIASKFEYNRHYQLFAVLAGVRNGYGFAGCPTGEAVKPIAEPRGLPSDFAMNDDAHPLDSFDAMQESRKPYHTPGEPLETWMGDHSHSWLSAAEILTWAESAPKVVKVGVLSREAYSTWDGNSQPASYSGDVMGRLIVKINDNAVEREQTPNWTHIRVSWESGLRQELAYFFDEVARLQAEHVEVRFVFGFDS